MEDQTYLSAAGGKRGGGEKRPCSPPPPPLHNLILLLPDQSVGFFSLLVQFGLRKFSSFRPFSWNNLMRGICTWLWGSLTTYIGTYSSRNLHPLELTLRQIAVLAFVVPIPALGRQQLARLVAWGKLSWDVGCCLSGKLSVHVGRQSEVI